MMVLVVLNSYWLFPKQCLHYGVLAEHKGRIKCAGLLAVWRPRNMIKKQFGFAHFQKKTVLAFEF